MRSGLDFRPDFAGAEVTPSPNHGSRRNGKGVDMIVLHYTGMDSGEAALQWLCVPASQVSCHYLVHEDGRVVQLVAEERRAWHAGQSIWQGETDINSRSIGIEIVNPGPDLGYPDFPDPQIVAVIALCRDIAGRHGIVPHRVLAHSDVAPARKQDPGEKFPWKRLHEAGIGHYVEPAAIAGGRCLRRGDSGPPIRELQTMLAVYGYGVDEDGAFGAGTEAVVAAFQRHFRPARVDGVADPSTVETLRRLLRGLPSPSIKNAGF